jgi:hypothetical protein
MEATLLDTEDTAKRPYWGKQGRRPDQIKINLLVMRKAALVLPILLDAIRSELTWYYTIKPQVG